MMDYLDSMSSVQKRVIADQIHGSGKIFKNIFFFERLLTFTFTNFIFVVIDYKNILSTIFSSSRITLHVSDYSSLRSLDDQIREGNNSTFNGMKNYFLINVPSRMENDAEGIKRLFEDSPLSFNSLTFAFLITNKTHGI